ncbi:MAG: chromosome segregation protein SMC, partial [Thermoanaerobaculia bacterium]
MEQGKIDLILSNKPQDRRKLIEEAAGITKYKTKRRAAELKLEETQQNLLRIDDTLSEVTRNLNSLKRQAGKARKHRELIDALSTAKRSLYRGRILAAEAEQQNADAGVSDAQGRERHIAEQAAHRESQLGEVRSLHADRASRASSIREDITRLASDGDRLRSFLQQSEANLHDLVQRLDTAREQIAAMEEEGAEHQTSLNEKTHALDGARMERNRLREISDQIELDRQDKSDGVRQFEKAIADARESLMRTIARISSARNEVHQIEIAVEKCEFYLTKLGDAARRAAENRDGARATVQDWDRRVSEAEEVLVNAQHASRDAVQLRDTLAERRDTMRESLASARDRVSQTTYRIDSLRTLLTSLESQEEDVRRVVLDLIPDATSAAEAVRAAEGYEAALDTLLREVSKAAVVANAETAVEAIARLRERGAGRGAFVALDYLTRAQSEQPSGEPALHGTRRGDAAYSVVGDGEIADAVRAAIPEAYIVGDLRQAVERAKERPSATFVTLDGDVVRGPLIAGGKTEGATPGVFSLKRQLSDLETLLGSEEVRASGISAELQTIERDLHAADDARILAEEHARTAEQELRDLRSQRSRAGSELDRFEKDLAVASEEQTLYAEEKIDLIRRRDTAVNDLHTLEEQEQATQASIHSNEEQLAAARTAFEEITEVAAKARVDVESATGNVNAIQREHENLARVVISIGSRITQLRSEIENLSHKQQETEGALAEARQQLETSVARLNELTGLRTSIEEEVESLHARVQELATGAVTAREEWNAAKNALFEAERRRDRARSGFDLLREQLALDLHAGIDALADVEPPAGDEARAALEAEVARLNDQIEKIGPVNVLAIEEHNELETRESFLRTQRDDLVHSIESLRTTIRSVNMTSRELFREAFEAVNKSFGEIFSSLFGGGAARMQLLDEEDVLESGIELVAQPPGKKNQSIALLSGGERALTALALLFAIFRYKPSPFCILDEVDAPLDEVNNERFVRLVREMSRDTQFIVITHSRRTMEAADVLYGVTMEEAGCSRLVSVQFADLEA